MLSAKNEEIPEIDDGMLWITLCLHQNAMNREGPRGRASSGYQNGGWCRRFSRVLSRWPGSLACHHFLHGLRPQLHAMARRLAAAAIMLQPNLYYRAGSSPLLNAAKVFVDDAETA